MKAHDILKLATTLVIGARAKTYGPMARLHGNIAILQEAYLKIRRDPDAPLNGEDVAHMQTLLKIARTQCGAGSDDSYVDGAAYQGIAGELHK